MDMFKTLICLTGIVSSARALRCYQCTSDQSGSGPCADTPNTDNMQVVNDCKGICYVSYSQTASGSVTSRGCYSRKSFCTETCIDIFSDINNCQHCCACNNCNDITKASLGTLDGEYDCGATTASPSTTTFNSRVVPEETVSTTVVKTTNEPVALPRGHAWRLHMSWQLLFIFALVALMGTF